MQWVAGVCLATAQPEKPNIVFIFIDDLSYGDVGSFGCTDLSTPNIDLLAESGVKCTNAYAVMPVCTPSRAGTMTGLYPQSFGLNGNMHRGTPIPEDHPTMAEAMRDAGYVTGMVGRWDLGSKEQGPLQEGFMEVARRSFIDEDSPLNELSDYPTTYYQEDEVYWTDRQGDEVVDFIDRHKDEPFFLYYAPLAVHSPVEEVPEHYMESIQGVDDERRRELGGTLLAVDYVVGRIMQALEDNNLERNTLVILSSDNGGFDGDSARHYPSQGGKGTEWDGGVHIPTVASWPGTIPAGTEYDGLMSTLDFYPTFVAAAGEQPPERCDGRNALPFLTGKEKGDLHDYLYFRYVARHVCLDAVRHGQWRLLRTRNDAFWRLYDLSTDPAEAHDVAQEHPDVVRELATHFAQWATQLPDYSGVYRGEGGEYPRGIGWATASDQ